MERTIINNKGFALAEAMIALVILTIAATALILPFASSATVEQQGIKQTIAAKLAGDLVEQILADPNSFSQIGADYDNYAEPNGQIRDANGIIFSGSLYADLSRNADCNYVYMPQQTNFGTQNFLKITVRVYQNGLKLSEITRLKGK
ncbi:MAG: prepilin-type N-terminal cleavage/methylation domain-containing protein [Sedimentisphaerales bacterium]